MRSGVALICRLASGRDRPVAARRIVSRELSGRVGASKLEELRLLVSELVTDRVRSLPAGRGIMLDLRAGETVRCAVVDDGPAGLPTVWGVAFLDRFADAWGVTPAHNRACIWFVASKHEIDR